MKTDELLSTTTDILKLTPKTSIRDSKYVNEIKKHIIGDEKIVDNTLYKLIGKYDCKNDIRKDILNTLYDILQDYSAYYIENIFDYIKENITEDYKYIITPDKNKTKILKYIKNEIYKYRNFVVDDDAFQMNINVIAYTALLKPQNTKIVITNKVLSTIGMSSFAPKEIDGVYGKWKSCMTLNYGDRYSRKVLSNICDTNSIILYVTNEKKTNLSQHPESDKITQDVSDLFEHETMIARCILRVMKEENGKEHIMIDRIYPDNKYLIEIFMLLDEILPKKIEIRLPYEKITATDTKLLYSIKTEYYEYSDYDDASVQLCSKNKIFCKKIYREYLPYLDICKNMQNTKNLEHYVYTNTKITREYVRNMIKGRSN